MTDVGKTMSDVRGRGDDVRSPMTDVRGVLDHLTFDILHLPFDISVPEGRSAMAGNRLPAFPVRHPRAFASPEQYLEWLCRRQLKGVYPLVTQGMEDRLGYELKAIGSQGLASWLLLLRELAIACPVRSTGLCAVGAAPGSLVCRCLGLTEVDPYRHGLLFERFVSLTTPVPMHADAAASVVPGLLE